MLFTTYDSRIVTAAVARRIARREVEAAVETPIGSSDKLIIARVFTTFMFEGTIHHLGETLCPTWNDQRQRARPFAYEPVVDRHKRVRRLLRLDNSGNEYKRIEAIINDLIDFRDSFAHPKVIEEATHYDGPPPEITKLPVVGWEGEVQVEKMRGDYDQVEAYCISLLDCAADILANDLASGGWTLVLERYPHLKQFNLTVAQLRGFLHVSRSGAFQCSYTPDASQN